MIRRLPFGLTSTVAVAVAVAVGAAGITTAGGCADPAGPGLGLGVVESPVVGGMDVPPGRWPDLVAVFTSGEQECTGTLIAPTVVLTAGHCIDDAIDHVLIGATSLAHPEAGEVITVYDARELAEADLGVLVLDTPSSRPPRAIASGWAGAAIQDGATVTIAGYGAIDARGMTYVDEAKEASTTIRDATCSDHVGCEAAIQPRFGELGAGGDGVDTCYGDSGGPLYLAEGAEGADTYVAGVTSRTYGDEMIDCGEGGIYVRPGAFAAELEALAGTPIARGPEPAVDPIATDHAGGITRITANDPVTADHAYAIAAPPGHGRAAVNGAGVVHVCPAADYEGADAVIVAITDARDSTREIRVPIAIAVAAGGDADDCDVDDFGDDGGGCCDAGAGAPGGPGSGLLAGAALALVLRRRRGVVASRHG